MPNVNVDASVHITDCPKPFVVDGTSSGGKCEAIIKNPIVGDGTQPAVFLSGQNMWTVRPTIRGKANCFAQGIFLNGSANNRVTVDPTNVDLAAISGGANKVVINATNITAPGYYLTDGTGTTTAGTGINVTGITA